MNYTLDFLEKEFAQHSKSFKECQAEHKKKREEAGWDTSDFEEGFCLPDALLLIIQEIKKLKGE